jgi:lysophospholipase L1-like esterase
MRLFSAALMLSLCSAAFAGDGLDRLAAKDSPLKDGDRIVFLGDSITAGGVKPGGYVTLIKEAVEKSGKKVEVIGAGISGNKVPDLQKRLKRDVLDKNPTIVWIYIGINDVWHSEKGKGTPKDQYEAGLKDIITHVQKQGATVVLATATVIGEKHNGENKLDAMLDEYCEISRKVAKEMNVTMCDLHEAFISTLKTQNTKNDEKGILTSDRVHLNAAGNALVADKAAGCIAAAAGKRK